VLSTLCSLDPLALFTVLLYALLLNQYGLSLLPNLRIGTARSHTPFSFLLTAYQDDLALATIAPVATQTHHQVATRDLADVKDMATGKFKGAQGIRKHACFVYKISCTIATLPAIHTSSFPPFRCQTREKSKIVVQPLSEPMASRCPQKAIAARPRPRRL
jgi:hypothetical protein